MPYVSPGGITSQRVMDCLVAFTTERGYPPTVKELAECLDVKTTAAHYWLKKLVKEGRIVRGDGPRAIRLVG